MAGHRVEFIDREFRAVRERVTDLDLPAGAGVRGGIVRFFRLGRGGIRVGLRVMVMREVNKGFGEGWCVGMVCKNKGGGADKVSEGIQSRLLVAVVWYPLV